MTYIDRIHLERWQSHEDSTFDLAPGVNAIVGSSDAGKSSVLRALRWVTTNRPRGTGFVHFGEGTARVEIGVGSSKIVRTRGVKKDNSYTVDGEVLEAMGFAVPEQVTELLPFDDVTFSSQHDPLYLVFETPGQFARKINDVVHLEDAERARSDLSGQVRSLTAKIKDCEEQLKEREAESKRLASVPTYEERTRDAADNAEEAEKLRKLLANLRSDADRLALAEATLSALPDMEEAGRLLGVSGETAEAMERDREQRDSLLAAVSAWDEAKPPCDKKMVKSLLHMVEEADKERLFGMGCGRDLAELDEVLKRLADVDEKDGDVLDTLVGAESELTQARTDLAECPSCGQDLTDGAKVVLCDG